MDCRKGLWPVSPDHLPYLKAHNAKGHHILIQPIHHYESYFILADDLNPGHLKAHHQFPDGTWKPGRMIVLTSPENYQVWIHSDRVLSVNEKRFWLRRMNSDPGADPRHRWGRCPGFFNKKEKHRSFDGKYPLAKLIWVDWHHTAHIPHTPVNRMTQDTYHGNVFQHPINAKTIRRSDYGRHNESVTDFVYSLALARRGYSKQLIIARLLDERLEWSHYLGSSRLQQYLERTVSKAIEIVLSTPVKNNSVILK